MPGPKGTHNNHDSFDGAEPLPVGPPKQPTPVKVINPADKKPGPRSPNNPSPDTFSE